MQPRPARARGRRTAAAGTVSHQTATITGLRRKRCAAQAPGMLPTATGAEHDGVEQPDRETRGAEVDRVHEEQLQVQADAEGEEEVGEGEQLEVAVEAGHGASRGAGSMAQGDSYGAPAAHAASASALPRTRAIVHTDALPLPDRETHHRGEDQRGASPHRPPAAVRLQHRQRHEDRGAPARRGHHRPRHGQPRPADARSRSSTSSRRRRRTAATTATRPRAASPSCAWR